jgi:hypothetical protein
MLAYGEFLVIESSSRPAHLHKLLQMQVTKWFMLAEIATAAAKINYSNGEAMHALPEEPLAESWSASPAFVCRLHLDTFYLRGVNLFMER